MTTRCEDLIESFTIDVSKLKDPCVSEMTELFGIPNFNNNKTILKKASVEFVKENKDLLQISAVHLSVEIAREIEVKIASIYNFGMPDKTYVSIKNTKTTPSIREWAELVLEKLCVYGMVSVVGNLWGDVVKVQSVMKF